VAVEPAQKRVAAALALSPSKLAALRAKR